MKYLMHHTSAQAVAHQMIPIKLIPKNIQHFFIGDHNTQKMMNPNETRLTVAITDPITSEGISLNLSQKNRLKKVIDLVINVSKIYQPTKRKLISKDILDVIHDQNTERNLSLIKRESDIVGFYF